jgi:hypothetical protein
MEALLCPLLDLGIHGLSNWRSTPIGRDQNITTVGRPVLALDFDSLAALDCGGDAFGEKDLVGWDAGEEDTVELFAEYRQCVIAVSSNTYTKDGEIGLFCLRG